MNSPAFNFSDYKILNAQLTFPDVYGKINLDVNFYPNGKFRKTDSTFFLFLKVVVTYSSEGSSESGTLLQLECRSDFQFSTHLEMHEIPDFFYPNSIAIIFPYIRAFISNLTLQANVTPVVLPTMNLMELKDNLKSNTQQVD